MRAGGVLKAVVELALVGLTPVVNSSHDDFAWCVEVEKTRHLPTRNRKSGRPCRRFDVSHACSSKPFKCRRDVLLCGAVELIEIPYGGRKQLYRSHYKP